MMTIEGRLGRRAERQRADDGLGVGRPSVSKLALRAFGEAFVHVEADDRSDQSGDQRGRIAGGAGDDENALALAQYARP